MTNRWLYHSMGNSVAFISNDFVYDVNAMPLGKLEGIEIWKNGSYIAEIVQDHYILKRLLPPQGVKGIPFLPLPALPPALPAITKAPIPLPAGFVDL